MPNPASSVCSHCSYCQGFCTLLGVFPVQLHETRNSKVTIFFKTYIDDSSSCGSGEGSPKLGSYRDSFITGLPPTGLESHARLLTDDVTCFPPIQRDTFASVRLFPSHYIGSRETHLGKTRGQAISSLTKMSLQAAVPGLTNSSSLSCFCREKIPAMFPMPSCLLSVRKAAEDHHSGICS